jgi:hypothetical protein
MVRLTGASLPWNQLADVGDAYGGASAILSAAALCGVGASLIFQQRQVRQELANIDRQQHMELLKLAIENPDLIEVLDADTARAPHARQQLYANLTMMYWLAVWQLGEVDEDELRMMAAGMFRSEITRSWWARYGSIWIGTRSRPDRRRFVSIVTQELKAAERAAKTTQQARSLAIDESAVDPSDARGAVLASLAAGASLGFVAAAFWRRSRIER